MTDAPLENPMNADGADAPTRALIERLTNWLKASDESFMETADLLSAAAVLINESVAALGDHEQLEKDLDEAEQIGAAFAARDEDRQRAINALEAERAEARGALARLQQERDRLRERERTLTDALDRKMDLAVEAELSIRMEDCRQVKATLEAELATARQERDAEHQIANHWHEQATHVQGELATARPQLSQKVLTEILLHAWASHPSTPHGQPGTPKDVYFSVEKAVEAILAGLAVRAEAATKESR